jgi:signal transduction histidine kinase
MGEQARQVATALSLTSEKLARDGDWDELNYRARELIKSRNILFVGYLDANARPKTLASRDLDFALANLTFDSQSLMQVSRRASPTFGEYLEVMAPILSGQAPSDETGQGSNGAQLIGYVAVGVSQYREEAQIARVRWLVIGIACVMVTLALPVAFFLVHRIFLPIRMLVTVSRQIIKGNMNVRTEIHRPDVIGDLARSFDEMVMRVKKHQEELAEANQQLADANRGLEEKIEQRTAQLEMANRQLSAEISEKEEFLRAVSHDLNAPLRNISGIATMLLTKHGQSLDQDVVYRLERIKSNVDVQTDLISELLELSRIKTRRDKIEPVSISKVIEDLRGVFENDLKSKAVELVVDTPLPTLNAERTRMRQLFQNLIDNAIKYMGDGPVKEIHIGCEIHQTEIEFYVRDTGIGIDPEDLNKVFFVFRRGRNGSSRSIGGKGVGLASVKSIVETYSGKIWVTSKPGLGSTFRFTMNGRYLPQPAPDGRAAA